MNEQFSTPYKDTPEDKSEDSGLRSVEDSKVPIPFSAKDEPYTVEYFGLENARADSVLRIEEYVMSEIERLGLEDTEASYEQVVKELFDKLGLTENHKGDIKFEKIIKYFDLLERNKSDDQKHRELLKRQKDAELSKEQRKKEALERNYHKAREERNKALNESKATKERFEKLETEHREAIAVNQAYQHKIQSLIDQQNAIMKTVEYQQYQTYQQRQAMEQQTKMFQQQLQEALQREQVITAKHNQLKSLMQ